MLPRALSDQFSSAESFMFFAAGLSSYREYRERNAGSSDYSSLDDSVDAFRDGVDRFPRDLLLQFYYALMLLEQASVIAERRGLEKKSTDSSEAGPSASLSYGGYADPVLVRDRQDLIDNALITLETYQSNLRQDEVRAGSELDDWLFLWSEYNRAAAQVHRLNPPGYVAARRILGGYLLHDIHLQGDNSQKDGRSDRLTLSLDALPLKPQSVIARLANWLLQEGNDADPEPGSPRTRRLLGWLRENRGTGEYAALLLQMESLLNLTLARPMREPETLRRLVRPATLKELGLFEELDPVEQMLDRFVHRVHDQELNGVVSREAIRDLMSDYWSQKGHLACARALRAAGCSPPVIFDQWSDLERPLDNAAAYKELAMRAPLAVRDYLEFAATHFRKALSWQPRWIPALQNLNEVEDVLTSIALRKR